jgi:hypothetical protein
MTPEWGGYFSRIVDQWPRGGPLGAYLFGSLGPLPDWSAVAKAGRGEPEDSGVRQKYVSSPIKSKAEAS